VRLHGCVCLPLQGLCVCHQCWSGRSAGALYTYSEEYISPNTYNFELTIMFLLAVIMGGRKTRSGALIGAVIVVMLPSLLSDIELFRKIATVLAVAVVGMAAYDLVRKVKTCVSWLCPWWPRWSWRCFPFS